MESAARTRTEQAATLRVLLVAPSPPPYGGMALQARLLERLLRSEGASVVFAASNFPFGPTLRWLDAPVLRTLARAVLIWGKLWKQAAEADVVHVLASSWLYFFLVVYPAVVVGRLRGKRVVLNYRGGEAKVFFDRYGWLTAPVFQLADVITVPSQFLAGIIREHFDVPSRIVPNILDTSAFPYRPRTTIRPRLLVTRHLEKIYDVESVLRAFREVQRNISDASLWIAGSGSQEAHLRSLVTEWDLCNVRFLGHVAHRDLPAIYDQCDIYVNGSRVDNFPGALLEASAAGLILVSTAAGGIRFVYEDGKNAFLVEPGDWQGLAVAVQRVLREPQVALELAVEAVALVRACDWQEVRRPLYEAYGDSLRTVAREVAGGVGGA